MSSGVNDWLDAIKEPENRWNAFATKNSLPPRVKETVSAVGFDPIGAFQWMPIEISIRWSFLLRFKRLSKGKLKQILANKSDSKKVMGILHDHLMKVAKIMAVPDVYIKDLSDLRYRVKLFRPCGGLHEEYLNRMRGASDKLLTAVFESLEGIDISSFEAI